MKSLLIFLLLIVPLLAEDVKLKQKEQQNDEQVPKDNNHSQVVPIVPDSLRSWQIKPYVDPQWDKDFQQRHGVLIVPNVEEIELNPGGIITADPSVDLGMILPNSTRQRIVTPKDRASTDVYPHYNFFSPDSTVDKVPDDSKAENEENSKDDAD